MTKAFTVIGMVSQGVYWLLALLSWVLIDYKSSAEFSLSFKFLVYAACFAGIAFILYLIDAIRSVNRNGCAFNFVKLIAVAAVVVAVYVFATDMLILNIYALCVFVIEFISLFVGRKDRVYCENADK